MSLPREWVRGPQWPSEYEREVWEPILTRAQGAWSELEVASITEGVRDSALVYLTPAELVTASADCARVGLELTPLASADGHVRAAVHRPGLADLWRAAWERSDDENIGLLLGFPGCCRGFFSREWALKGSSDVVPAMTTVEGPWEANILLRWLGVRLVPHLPCSGDCGATLAQAREYLLAGERAGVDVAAIETLLRLPVTYSAVHGVAVVTTPHFRFMAGADPVPVEVAATRAAQPREPHPWEDCGFSTKQAMDDAHGFVAAVVGRVSSALDLGSGDGSLLRRIMRNLGPGYDEAPPGDFVGIESDEGRSLRGAMRHGPVLHSTHARIQDVDRWRRQQFDVVLITPLRLLEMGPEDRVRVKESLRQYPRVVAYAYGDVLDTFGSLRQLARVAGMEVQGEVVVAPGVQAADVRVL
jgi:hypothetical protein